LLWHFALAWAVGAVVAGIWCAFLAWQLASPWRGMLAVTLLLSAPMLAVAVFLARPRGPSDGDLLADIHRADKSLRAVRLARAHLGVAGSYVFVLWFCQLTGYMSLREFLVFYTVAFVLAAASFLPWLQSSERQLLDERAECRRLLGEAGSTPWNPAFTRRNVS
jgi:MFS family permease